MHSIDQGDRIGHPTEKPFEVSLPYFIERDRGVHVDLSPFIERPFVPLYDSEFSQLIELPRGRGTVDLEGGLPPLDPGESTTFYVTAAEGESLSFASMFVPSNDAFFAPGEDGISLFGDGSPVSGDVTDQLTLWDAGTEENQEPGVGPDIKPNQSPTAIDVGSDEYESVRPVADVDDQYEFPSVSDVISVTVEPQ